MTKLLIATRNDHKVAEIRAILGVDFQCFTLRDFPGAPEVVEDAKTFAGNAGKKAQEIARWLKLQPGALPDYILADDSGLEVDVLGGAPGVYSARFAAQDSGRVGNSSDGENNAKLLQLLADQPRENRTARFRCVMVLVSTAPQVSNDMMTWQGEGVCEGWIDFGARGGGGFGYDPLFIPSGFEVSFAQLGETTKNQISHRAHALEKLKAHFATMA
ncbi:MAG: non-canonical purine NTP pyrophosphatase [Verrucomicrobiota bacterium]